jgi:hypothetical protein
MCRPDPKIIPAKRSRSSYGDSLNTRLVCSSRLALKRSLAHFQSKANAKHGKNLRSVFSGLTMSQCGVIAMGVRSITLGPSILRHGWSFPPEFPLVSVGPLGLGHQWSQCHLLMWMGKYVQPEHLYCSLLTWNTGTHKHPLPCLFD